MVLLMPVHQLPTSHNFRNENYKLGAGIGAIHPDGQLVLVVVHLVCVRYKVKSIDLLFLRPLLVPRCEKQGRCCCQRHRVASLGVCYVPVPPSVLVA